MLSRCLASEDLYPELGTAASFLKCFFFFFLTISHRMQGLSSPTKRSNLRPLQWKGRILTTGPPRESLWCFILLGPRAEPGSPFCFKESWAFMAFLASKKTEVEVIIWKPKLKIPYFSANLFHWIVSSSHLVPSGPVPITLLRQVIYQLLEVTARLWVVVCAPVLALFSGENEESNQLCSLPLSV